MLSLHIYNFIKSASSQILIYLLDIIYKLFISGFFFANDNMYEMGQKI